MISSMPTAEIERTGRAVARALEHLGEILQLGLGLMRASATAPSLPHFNPVIAGRLDISQRAAQARLEESVRGCGERSIEIDETSSREIDGVRA